MLGFWILLLFEAKLVVEAVSDCPAKLLCNLLPALLILTAI